MTAIDIAITLLGRFSVTVDTGPVDPSAWQRRHAASLVKVLALTPARRLHRERVMDALWPQFTVEEAAPRLHKAAHYARRALGDPSSVALAGEVVSLFPHREVRVDAEEFEGAARAALQSSDPVAAGRAADSYAGDLLPEDLYESWIVDARERLRLTYLDLLRLAGRWEQVVAVEPTDEQAHLNLISELANRGDSRGALRQFERLELALRRELGVGPSQDAVVLRTRLLAARPRSHVGPSEASGPTLIGRAAERRHVDELLDLVAAGTGRTLFVGGPGGVGKTALLSSLEAQAVHRGMRAGTGVAAQVEGAWPYAPVLEALADLSRRHPALLDGLDDELRREIESGLSGRTLEWNAVGGHQRLYVAAAELVRLAAAGAGAVLVVDDAHLADAASLRLLHYLARTTVSDRVLLVLGHRLPAGQELASIRQSLLGRGTAIGLDLQPLARDGVRALVQHIAPAADEELCEAVWAASGGLPLIVVELARAAAGGRELSAESLLPVVLDQQFESLVPAAVFGTTFDTDEFLELTHLTEHDAYVVLEQAAAQHLLVRTRAGWQFGNSMVREALLAGLSPSALRSLHAEAARALRTLGRPAARIGHHLVQAGDRAGAVPWMLEAAETSAALGAFREALDYLARVRAPATGADLSRLLSLRADLLMAGAEGGAVDAYREALAAVSDPVERSKLLARLARAAVFAGDLETARLVVDRLGPDDAPSDPTLLMVKGMLAFFRGDLDTTAAAAVEARQRLVLGAPEEWQMFDLITLEGFVAHTRGEWFERLRMELRRGVKRPDLAARIFDSHLCVAEYMLYGPTPYAEVLALAEELRDTAERAGVLRAVAFATALRGEAAFLMGDVELAASELADAVDLHRDIGSTAGEAHSLQRLAEVKVAQGDRAEATRLLQRAVPLGRLSGMAVHVILRVYGTLVAAAGDATSARAAVEVAEAALGVDDYCPFCSVMFHVPAAVACANVGDVQNAQQHLQAAERSARLWEGTAWQASLLEVRAHIALAVGDDRAKRFWTQAADLFDAAGQPLDARRCRNGEARAVSGVR